MMNNLATREQSAAIRARMKQIREELPHDVDDARRQMRQLTDWRYQFRKHPAALMTAVAVVGYLLVPQARKNSDRVLRANGSEPSQLSKPARRGLVSGLVAAAATMALKSGTTMLTQHLSKKLLSATQRPISAGEPMRRHANGQWPANTEVPS